MEACLGFDTEFIPENTYYPKLALIQFAVADQCYIVDPLSNLDLSPLDELMRDEGVVKVVHAGAQDMGIFYHRMGGPPKRVFDTQIAASFLGMGQQISYASLVQQLFGVTLKKGQSYTNWLKRPLHDEQIRYALEDVAWLVKAYYRMVEMLTQAGRSSWVAKEMVHYEDGDFYEASAAHPEKRVKKSGHMRGRDLVVLEALARWRENEARTRDLPRKKILSDYILVDLARRKPTSPGELLSLRSADHMAKRYVADLVRIIVDASESEPEEFSREQGNVLSDEKKMVVEFISFCLKVFCQREKLSSTVLSNRAELDALVQDYFSNDFDASHHRLLTGWRKEAVGNDILKCLRGELGVRYDCEMQKLRFTGGDTD